MASDDDLIEAAPCPNCRSPLTVSAGDLGHLIECPSCGTQFRARRAGPEAPPPPSRRRDEDPPPRRRPRDEEMDDRDRFGEDRPRRSSGRSRFDDDRDRDYDDDRYDDRPSRRKTPGALVAMAVMDFVYGGILLICGGLGTVGLFAINQNQGMMGMPPMNNMAMEVGLVFCYLATALVMIFAGVMALQRKGRGLSVAAMGLAAITFVVGLVNFVMTLQNKQPGPFGGGQGQPGQEVGMVCGFAMLAIFWLGYLVTNGILLAKSGRHFR